jgi:hypothetical protein
MEVLTCCRRPLHLTLADVSLRSIPNDIILPWLRKNFPLILDRCESISVSLDQCSMPSTHGSSNLLSLKSVLASSKHIKAVRLVDYDNDMLPYLEKLPVYSSSMLDQTATEPAWKALEELQINVTHLLPVEAKSSGLCFWQQQGNWSTLRRLYVEGRPTSFGPLFCHAKSLSSLVSLKLRFTASRAGFNQVPVPEIVNFPFMELETLREVELELSGTQIRPTYLINPNLRRWSCRSAVPYVKLGRPPGEVVSLVNLCPMLEEVEIPVGMISNLWNGHAISGVDVDVQVYGVLGTLAKLPQLRKLRLFPPYRADTYRDDSTSQFRQPLDDDEQAIKIFRHLKSQCPTLEEVAISTDNELAIGARIFDEFYPMSWTIHVQGTHTILVTRQASRDYEQRQVWVGERRLTTEIRRYAYLKPYVPDTPGWLLQTSARGFQL